MNREPADPNDVPSISGDTLPQSTLPQSTRNRAQAPLHSEAVPGHPVEGRRINLLAWASVCVIGAGIWALLFKAL